MEVTMNFIKVCRTNLDFRVPKSGSLNELKHNKSKRKALISTYDTLRRRNSIE